MDAVEVKQWLNARRADSVGGISVDQAARVLGLKQQVAYDLVRRGFLRSMQSDGHGHRVSLGDIEQFQESYVSLAELAHCEHRTPRALLRDSGVAPVTGPSIDRSRQYFFRRSDVPGSMARTPGMVAQPMVDQGHDQRKTQAGAVLNIPMEGKARRPNHKAAMARRHGPRQLVVRNGRKIRLWPTNVHGIALRI